MVQMNEELNMPKASFKYSVKVKSSRTIDKNHVKKKIRN